jgi:hypothetical protein
MGQICYVYLHIIHVIYDAGVLRVSTSCRRKIPRFLREYLIRHRCAVFMCKIETSCRQHGVIISESLSASHRSLLLTSEYIRGQSYACNTCRIMDIGRMYSCARSYGILHQETFSLCLNQIFTGLCPRVLCMYMLAYRTTFSHKKDVPE